MRYRPDQKQKARAELLEAGARVLRKQGFNGIGVDGLAGAAGVTSGAFYSNFANKEALLDEVIAACLGKPFVDAQGSVAERRLQLDQWLDHYISEFHRENAEFGCVMPTLSSDVARSGPAVRNTYAAKMMTLAGKIAGVIDAQPAEQERRAWSLIAQMVGAVMIAQAMPDAESARAVLAAARQTASELLR